MFVGQTQVAGETLESQPTVHGHSRIVAPVESQSTSTSPRHSRVFGGQALQRGAALLQP